MRLCRGIEAPKVSFAMDSAQEEAGFEPLVPLTLNARCLTLNLNRVRR
jgi:hypothetical protein